jgi:serine/threonine-protein kinase
MANSQAGEASRADVDEYPVDESPYGARGVAGNTRDLCLNVWTLSGPEAPGGRLLIEPPPVGGDEFRSTRGGSWRSIAGDCVAAARRVARPGDGWHNTGLRLARPCP